MSDVGSFTICSTGTLHYLLNKQESRADTMKGLYVYLCSALLGSSSVLANVQFSRTVKSIADDSSFYLEVPLTHSLTHSLTQPRTVTSSVPSSVTHSHPLTHVPSLMSPHSLNQSLTQSLTQSITHSLNHSPTPTH